jgi:hypothetical protein
MTKYQASVLDAVRVLGGKATCQQIANHINSNAVTVAAAGRRLQKQGETVVTDERTATGYVRVFVSLRVNTPQATATGE